MLTTRNRFYRTFCIEDPLFKLPFNDFPWTPLSIYHDKPHLRSQKCPLKRAFGMKVGANKETLRSTIWPQSKVWCYLSWHCFPLACQIVSHEESWQFILTKRFRCAALEEPTTFVPVWRDNFCRSGEHPMLRQFAPLRQLCPDASLGSTLPRPWLSSNITDRQPFHVLFIGEWGSILFLQSCDSSKMSNRDTEHATHTHTHA